MKLLTRALGSKETAVPDFLSLLMFEPHYTERLIALGQADVESRLDELRVFLGYSNESEAEAS
jgi:NTE family protein